MASVVNSTPVARSHAHPSGAVIPTTVTADFLTADLSNISYVREVFDAANGCRIAYDTFRAILEATRDGGAVVVLYIHGTDVAARALFPVSVTLTKADEIVCKAFCTMRQEWRTFRLDRMLQCHPFVLPQDAAKA